MRNTRATKIPTDELDTIAAHVASGRSLRAYARGRGVSHTAVIIAYRQHRLEALGG